MAEATVLVAMPFMIRRHDRCVNQPRAMAEYAILEGGTFLLLRVRDGRTRKQMRGVTKGAILIVTILMV